jgi:hypothetical protein
MSKLMFAVLLFASAVTYKPAAFRGVLHADLQSIGLQLRSAFDVGRIFPGLFHSGQD